MTAEIPMREDRDFSDASFEEFMVVAESRVRRALIPIAGPEAARDATIDGLVEVWRRWDRVQEMVNPVGYLYTVARRRLPRRPRPGCLDLPVELAGDDAPDPGEPQLGRAMMSLPERQRAAVYLVIGCGWSAPEVAELTGVAATTVRTHLDRGLARLRSELGVNEEDLR